MALAKLVLYHGLCYSSTQSRVIGGSRHPITCSGFSKVRLNKKQETRSGDTEMKEIDWTNEMQRLLGVGRA